MTDIAPALLDEPAAAGPDSPALIVDGCSVSFSQLAGHSRRVAAAMISRGVMPGDRVAIWLLNDTSWLATFFACARIGAVAIAVNTRFRETELADIFERFRPGAIVYRTRYRSTDYSEILSRASKISGHTPRLGIVTEGSGLPGAVTLDELTGQTDPLRVATPENSTPSETTDLVMFSTSGTTSAPKFVVHTHGSIIRHARDVARDFSMNDDDAVMLQALPYCGVFGFCQAMAALAAGRPSIVQETYDPAGAALLIAEHRVTHFNATDEMLMSLSDATPGTEGYGSLRLVGAASFNRGPDTLADLSGKRHLPIVGLYGMSEVQALYARRSNDDPDEQRFHAGGSPVSPVAEFRVRDPDSGAVCARGEHGELEVRGPSQFREYAGDRTATRNALTADGFVRTGDLGFLDDRGSFSFVSRIGDALRLGGFLVNPAEISTFIDDLPGIEQCIVVGATLGDRTRPVAFVRPETGHAFNANDVIEACEAGLAPFKVPARVFAVETFPVTDGPNGEKVQRGALREMARELIEN